MGLCIGSSGCHEYRGEKDRCVSFAAGRMRDVGWKISASPRRRLVGVGLGELGDVEGALVAALDCD